MLATAHHLSHSWCFLDTFQPPPPGLPVPPIEDTIVHSAVEGVVPSMALPSPSQSRRHADESPEPMLAGRPSGSYAREEEKRDVVVPVGVAEDDARLRITPMDLRLLQHGVRFARRVGLEAKDANQIAARAFLDTKFNRTSTESGVKRRSGSVKR